MEEQKFNKAELYFQKMKHYQQELEFLKEQLKTATNNLFCDIDNAIQSHYQVIELILNERRNDNANKSE